MSQPPAVPRAVRFRSVGHSFGGGGQTVRVRRGLLAVIAWMGVVVTRESRRGLSVLERFVLESAIALPGVRIGELARVTQLPAGALRRTAARLAAAGAVSRSGAGDTSGPLHPRPAAHEALQRQELVEHTRGRMDFVYLPRSDDLLAFAPMTQPALLGLPTVMPEYNAPVPVPAAAARMRVEDFLRERVARRAVANLPADVVEVPLSVLPQVSAIRVEDADLPHVPPVAPAYEYFGQFEERGGQTHASITLRASLAGSKNDEDDEDGSYGRRLELNVRGAAGLIGYWKELCEQLHDPDHARAAVEALCGAGAEGGLSQGTEGGWTVSLGEELTRRLAHGRLLMEPRTLLVEADDVEIEIPLRLCPRDPGAAQLFALDQMITDLLKRTAPEDRIECAPQALSQWATSKSDVQVLIERTWELGLFPLTYRLREVGDFNYL